MGLVRARLSVETSSPAPALSAPLYNNGIMVAWQYAAPRLLSMTNESVSAFHRCYAQMALFLGTCDHGGKGSLSSNVGEQ